MKSTSVSNNQKAFEYALYMIASSYFDEAVCNNRVLETNMLLHYKEQKKDSQYKMEEVCIQYLDNLQKRVPKKLFNQKVTTHLISLEDDTVEIIFKSNEYILVFNGTYEGTRSKIECRIWKRNKLSK